MSYCVEHVMPRICVVRSALPSETSQSPGVCCPCLFIRCADEWRPATRRDHPRVRSGCRPKGVRCTGQRVCPGRRPLRGSGGHPPDKSGPVTWPRTCLRRCRMDRFLLLTARIHLPGRNAADRPPRMPEGKSYRRSSPPPGRSKAKRSENVARAWAPRGVVRRRPRLPRRRRTATRRRVGANPDGYSAAQLSRAIATSGRAWDCP